MWVCECVFVYVCRNTGVWAFCVNVCMLAPVSVCESVSVCASTSVSAYLCLIIYTLYFQFIFSHPMCVRASICMHVREKRMCLKCRLCRCELVVDVVCVCVSVNVTEREKRSVSQKVFKIERK